MEDTKQNETTQIRFLETKTTISEMKNTLIGVNGRLDIAEEMTGELEDIIIGSIQNESQ